MQNPNPSPEENKKPTAKELFESNRAVNTENLMPTLGWPTVESYRPSGKIGPLGWPLLIASLIFVPLVMGFLNEKVGHFGEMGIFSTLFVGALVGAALYVPVHFGKVRNPILAGFLGFVIGAATFGNSMFLEAQSYRESYIAYDADFLVKTKGMKPQQAYDVSAKFYSPLNLTRYYWQDRAQMGVTLTSTKTRSNSQLSGGMFWALEALEFFIVALCGGVTAALLAKRRFSEEKHQWFTVKPIYSVHPRYVVSFIEALNAGNFAQAGRIGATSSGEGQPGAQAILAYLNEKPGAVLTIKARVHKNKDFQPIYERELNGSQVKEFAPQFALPAQPESPFNS